jgi:hypothetical protein
VTAKDGGVAGHATPGDAPLHGRRFEPADAAAWQAVLAEAFDYRGDVTLRLNDGSSVEGYLFAHEPKAREPHVKVMTADAAGDRRVVPIARIAALEFSGDDKATGRSWQAWVRRYEEKKRLLAEGVDVGDIEPRPEAL